jgi:hypothetical protein
MKFVSSLREKRHKATSPIALAKKFMPLSERHFPGNCRAAQMPEPDAVRLAAVCRDVRRPESGQKRYLPVHLPRISSSRVKITLGLAI